MPSINDRIGSQNVIRVLSNASAPPSRLLNLTDVDSTSQTDGNLLIWDASTNKFVMGRDLDGTEGYVFTGGTGNVGIVTFSGTTQSESTLTGAVIISGGLAVGKNANFADGLNVVGIATFSNEIDINAAVDILRGLNVAGVTSVASLNIGATQVISSDRELQNIVSLDATTTATIEAAIVVAPNTFTDLKISGISTFIGIATYAAGLEVFSGVSTFNAAVDIDAGLDVDGQTDLDEVVIAGVTTFNNADVVFQGAAAGQNITFDASENDLEFTDNARIKFGNNDDLEIWHDGTNSNIKNSTGDFHIRSDSLALKTADNSERYLKATKNEDVKLYYNGNEKFATTGTGVTVLGTAETQQLNVTGVSTFAGATDFNGNVDIDGDTELDDANISGIATVNTLEVTQSTTLKHAGSTKFTTTGTGVSISSGTGNTAIIAAPENLIIDPAAVGDDTGRVTIKGDLFVLGTETKISSQTIELADHRVGIATTVGTNLLLNGGGIGIGSTAILKTILWNNASTSLKSSENWDLASGKSFKINGTDVLTSTTLGTGVTNSSLTSVGTLNSLNVSGLSTFTGIVTTVSDLYVGGDLYVADDLTFDEFTASSANITGIATIGTLGVTGLTTTQNLRVAGLSTFVGVATFSTNVFVAGTLDAGLIDGGSF